MDRNVLIKRNESSEPLKYTVMNAYTKGPVYCVLFEKDGVRTTHKFPLGSLYCVTEDYIPSKHGELSEKVMLVEIQREETSQPIELEAYNTFTTRSMYCVVQKVESEFIVEKYPLCTLFRMIEGYNASKR